MKNGKTKKQAKTPGDVTKRPPVVVVMGHIDHGKSTLLDYIRKSKVAEGEAGGITQHVSAYEVLAKNEKGKEEKITFIDTPGHEAFSAARSRGASVADIAVLVVAADDGVNTQTIEAYKSLKETNTPFVVAITKIDKTGASAQQAKSSLVENEIYVEGFGGDISCVEISSKTGEGIDDLLEIILLTAELEELTGDASLPASGIVLESNIDPKRGTTGTILIKEGTLKKGLFVVSGNASTPVRIMEDFSGKMISEASFSSPIRLVGWSTLPEAGADFQTVTKKKEAAELVATNDKPEEITTEEMPQNKTEESITIPLIIKTDVIGTRDGVLHEIEKLKGKDENVLLHVITSEVGDITEKDVLLASGSAETIILGFNVKADTRALRAAERNEISIQTFDVIYQMTKWLEEEIQRRRPEIEVEEATAIAKIKRVFSHTKNAFVAGGKVKQGTLKADTAVKIYRRDAEISRGKIMELQEGKVKTDKVEEGQEFGIKLETKVELVAGDSIETFITKKG